MAVWVLARALEMLELLPEERSAELAERIGLGDDERARWDAISRRMRVVFMADGIPAAFEGYETLHELDWDAYRARHGDIHRLDRILEAEGDSVNRYKAGKQADVLMLMYLFSAEELAELFERLGYDFDPALIPRTVAYYAARTTHGSTLSRVVDAWVLARADRRHSWEQLQLALRSDVDDVQGGTTAEGIHLGAMAGTVDVLQRGYTGIETRGDTLWLNPCLPEEVRRLRLLVRYRGHAIELDIGPDALEICARDHARAFTAAPVRVGVRDEVFMLAAGERRNLALLATQAPRAKDDRGSGG
jgi:trehalose/maltose hydrolase-like predicted phosphorylase